jgi:hypothetical protein
MLTSYDFITISSTCNIKPQLDCFRQINPPCGHGLSSSPYCFRERDGSSLGVGCPYPECPVR